MHVMYLFTKGLFDFIFLLLIPKNGIRSKQSFFVIKEESVPLALLCFTLIKQKP